MINYFNILTIFLLLNIILPSDNINAEKKYIGGWPISKNIISSGPDMKIECPNETGCSCSKDSDCLNNNCEKLPKGKYCIPKNGDYFPDFSSTDQFGEEVRLYDFSNQGKYILVEMGTTWCPPCHMLAGWLTFNDQEIASKRFWKDEYQVIYDLVQSNKIYYVTVLYENDYRENITPEDVEQWFTLYPDDKIPILGDYDKFLHSWIKPTGLPAILLLNEKMEIVTFSSRGMNLAFDSIINIYEADEK